MERKRSKDALIAVVHKAIRRVGEMEAVTSRCPSPWVIMPDRKTSTRQVQGFSASREERVLAARTKECKRGCPGVAR